MADQSLIKLENVWKTYRLGERDLSVLKEVSLEIPLNGFTVIFGPSGSGKSTLLNIIGCLDVATKGKVFLEGEDVSLLSEDELAKLRGKKIGFVFQQFNLLPHLTSIENVYLPMIFQGVPEKERKEKAQSLLVSLGLGERINHRPAELSGGEQQRVAIARALANDPEIIVADEPTGNLDSASGRKLIEILLDLNNNKKKTIVMVTHDSYLASQSKEVTNIIDGEIVGRTINKEKA
ncbi:MAG: ABC transporter ATP-binding protein [bacterium]